MLHLSVVPSFNEWKDSYSRSSLVTVMIIHSVRRSGGLNNKTETQSFEFLESI